MTTLVVATRNRHKAGEIAAVLGGEFRLLTLDDFPGAPEVVEDAGTFEGNSVKKAAELAGWLSRGREAALDGAGSCHVLADDSGLEVDALDGAPGVHSARFAALDSGGTGNASDAANNLKLLRLLEGVSAEARTGRFRCVLALVPLAGAGGVFRSGGREQAVLFEGMCEGRIDVSPRGRGGFGYDPLFIPDGHEKSFAELGEEIKNAISHRARALSKLREHLGQRGPIGNRQ